MPSRFGRRLLTWLSLATLVLCAGCNRESARPEGAAAADLPELVLDTPEDAARTVLTCLRAETAAVAAGDEQRREECVALLKTVAAVTDIEAMFAGHPRFRAALGEDLIEGYVANWGAVISYYADGLHLDQMHRVSESKAKVTLAVPASGPRDEAVIQITCLRQPDETWHVQRVEFLIGAVTSRPASPASAPATSEPP